MAKRSIRKDTFKDGQELQDEIFRKMSNSERVGIAFAFSDLIREVAKDGIRNQNPSFSEEDVKNELARRSSFAAKLWRNKLKSLGK